MMIEAKANIFTYPGMDAICFTSNGIVKQNGQLVMGAGIAAAFALKWPELPRIFGNMVKAGGNRVYPAKMGNTNIVSFPTKHDWKSPADLLLIVESAKQLALLSIEMDWKNVATVRPGCSNGQQSWSTVGPLLETVWDSDSTKYHILTP